MSELPKKFVRPIASDGQSTALRRALRTEGANDGEATRLQRPQRLGHVAPPLRFTHQEVKDRAVVPQVLGCCR